MPASHPSRWAGAFECQRIIVSEGEQCFGWLGAPEPEESECEDCFAWPGAPDLVDFFTCNTT
jgi:hypothetical protein